MWLSSLYLKVSLVYVIKLNGVQDIEDLPRTEPNDV